MEYLKTTATWLPLNLSDLTILSLVSSEVENHHLGSSLSNAHRPLQTQKSFFFLNVALWVPSLNL